MSHLWILRKDRDQHCGRAAAMGLRVRYADAIDREIRTNLDGLIRYLRRLYFFPVRCNVYITNHESYRSERDGHVYYGVFYDNEGVYPKKKLYPEIYVAGQVSERFEIENIMFSLLHELSHYFQWIGDRETGRTDRSIEVEATRWANRIMEAYKAYSTIQTPFGELNIYVDGQLINYLPVRIAYDRPPCKDKPLAACYRIYGSIEAGQTVRAVIEPLADCRVSDCSGERYECCEFYRDKTQMTIGTVDYEDDLTQDSGPYVVSPIANGLEFRGGAKRTDVIIGLAWVNDYGEYDNRTWFAADPTLRR
ncbi:MAG: hypothetical protein IKB28_00775 [Clostridia bacterium]|nr:hypothetical protein [Clostridia bacterium]